jgi:hypothetical protein
MKIPFNNIQQEELKACVRPKHASGFYQDTENTALAHLILRMKIHHPEMFHDEDSLKSRVFYDEPATSVPYTKAIFAL